MVKFSIDLNNFKGFTSNPETPAKGHFDGKVEKKNDLSAVKKYKDYMETGEIIEMAFAQQEWDKGLWKKEDGVEINLPNEELGDGNMFYMKLDALNRIFSVVVYDVDEQKNIVYVSLKRAQAKVRPKVIDMINATLRKGEVFYAPAKIAYISRVNSGKRYCLLDIMGLGIQGLMIADDWSHEFLYDLNKVARVGEVIPVGLMKTTARHNATNPQYQCSRKATMEAPAPKDWSKVEEEFPLNSRVSVRCLKLYDRNFIGQVIGSNWVVYCFYPDKEKYPGVHVLEGGCYRGFVSHVSAANKMLRIRITEQIAEDVASLI